MYGKRDRLVGRRGERRGSLFIGSWSNRNVDVPDVKFNSRRFLTIAIEEEDASDVQREKALNAFETGLL